MLKLLSLFSGIGAFEKALDNLGVDYDLVGYCEIDKYASKSYSVIHNVPESKNFGDITKVDENALPKDIDLVTYGFPCQDISLAGKQKGLFNEDGTQTRSGLFFEALRIIEATKPKIAIAENVKNLVSKKFNAQFQVVLASLDAAGYNSYWSVLNAKDFGIPQNRERVFIVSIRKDLDTGLFEFPKAFPLDKRLKDLLEESVDEKYYLTEHQMKSIIQWKAQQKPFERVLGNSSISPTLTARGAGENHSGMIIYSPDNEDTRNMQLDVTNRFGIDKSNNNPSLIDIANCLTSREDRGVSNRRGEGTAICEVKQVGQIYPDGGNPQAGRVYDADGISPTMDTCSGGNRMPKVLVREATKKGYAEAYEGDSVNLEQPNSTTRRGRVGKQMAQTLTTTPQQGAVISEPKIEVVGNYSPSGHDASRIVSSDGLAPTVKENHGTVTATIHNLRIRKLTPKECFRLMGFDDESFHRAEAVNSNTQLYKQAGNSIVVDVLEELLCMMLDEDGGIYV